MVSFGSLLRQTSAGLIVGVSAVIYSISYGALLFSGPLALYVGYGITVALITAVIGALFGLWSEESSFINGPDANTISVLASMFATLGALGLAADLTLKLALGSVVLASLVSAVVFYALAKLKLADLVRYVPFSVMAGFLASTGWLMSSGALNIIAGLPLTVDGLKRYLDAPFRPELIFGLLVVAALYGFAHRISRAVLIPLVVFLASVAVHVYFSGEACGVDACARDAWFFSELKDGQWLPPWKLELSATDAASVIQQLPAVLVISFVGLVSILLSLASLELIYKKEFDLNRELKAHAFSSGISALVGGFVGIISIGRTSLNRDAGGGPLSGVIAAALCVAALIGGGDLIAYVPKAALGALVLYLGINMLKQWLWDQRKSATRVELAQIVLILVLVANYGYLVGFLGGLVISCFIFVITYSRIPLASVVTDLSLFSSTVVRPQHHVDTLKQYGDRTLVYRLKGYVFFGSASKIDAVFSDMATDQIDGVVIDFSNVSGIDRSAIGIFQRILRRYQNTAIQFYFIYAENNQDNLQLIGTDPDASRHLSYFRSFDHALEAAEDKIIHEHRQEEIQDACFGFLEAASDRTLFMNCCEFRTSATGELLCRTGEYSDEIFFVANGSFEVVGTPDLTSRLRFAKLTRGAMAGEMAFFTGEARTASIVALGDAEVYVLHKHALTKMRAEHPELTIKFDRMVICKLAESLRRTNRLLASMG